jgi:hypothetical protein
MGQTTSATIGHFPGRAYAKPVESQKNTGKHRFLLCTGADSRFNAAAALSKQS